MARTESVHMQRVLPDSEITIVIPAFNRADIIGACLRSVQEQTYEQWVAFIVDDGSSDKTPDVIASYSCDDPRIRLLQLPHNQGAQAARNAGIRAARSPWIAFLDSDDRYLPDSIEVRLAVARREQVSVVHSNALWTQPDGHTKPLHHRAMSGWVYRDVLKAEGPMFPSLLVRREALERIGYLDERIVAYQEWDTAIRLARHYKFAFVDKPTFVWSYTRSDAISSDMLRGGRGYEQVVRKHCLAMLRHGGPPVLAHHFRRIADRYRKGGAGLAALRCRLQWLMWTAVDVRRHPARLGRLTSPAGRET